MNQGDGKIVPFPNPKLNDWIAECTHYHGRVLVGKYAHWCSDWDFLPIDETCPEWECCVCYGNDVRAREGNDGK